MEYKRLTKKSVDDGTVQIYCADRIAGCYHKDKMILERLCKLEDKIEQGTLIELPIAHGTELHFLYSREHYGKPQPACVHSTRTWIFNIGYDGKMWFSVAGRGIGYYGDYTHELGKTVFLTREEANQRLKELQE